jgi:hypothetical protein
LRRNDTNPVANLLLGDCVNQRRPLETHSLHGVPAIDKPLDELAK